MADTGVLQRDGATRGFAVYRRQDGGAYALKSGLLVGAGSRADLQRALALAVRGAASAAGEDTDDLRSPSLSKAALFERLRGLPGRSRSALRATIDLDAIERDDDGERQIPWVGALRRASFALVPDEDAVSVPFRFETDPEAVTEGDVPIATGVRAPAPAAEDDTPVVIGLRDVSHTIEFVRRTLRATNPKLASDIDSIENNLRRYARVDPTSQILSKLTGTTTITTDLDGTFTAAFRTRRSAAGVRRAVAAAPRLDAELAGRRHRRGRRHPRDHRGGRR